MRRYEYRNRFIAPIVRRGLSWILGWRYHGSEDDRRRLVRQLALIAFRPRGTEAEIPLAGGSGNPRLPRSSEA